MRLCEVLSTPLPLYSNRLVVSRIFFSVHLHVFSIHYSIRENNFSLYFKCLYVFNLIFVNLINFIVLFLDPQCLELVHTKTVSSNNHLSIEITVRINLCGTLASFYYIHVDWIFFNWVSFGETLIEYY